MSEAECLFQSFEGAGSIFVSQAASLTPHALKRHTCGAIVILNPHKKAKGEPLPLSNLRQISISVEGKNANLPPLFHTASLFISEARKTTNIMIWSPSDRELAAVFVFAHLILRYGYSLDYIWRLYHHRITDIAVSEAYLHRLRNLSKKQSPEDETAKKLKDSTLGKRMLRIRKEYAELAKDSHRDWTSERKSQRGEGSNPERPMTSRRGDSETDFVVECCESEPSTHVRARSSTGSELKPQRNIFKSFDLEY